MQHKTLISILVLITIVTLILVVNNGLMLLPLPSWYEVAFGSHFSQANALLFHYNFLPRIVVAVLVGAGLGLAGWLCQLLLRNPLAEPTTLGIASGAQLGVACATLLGLNLWQQQGMTIVGGLLATLLVFVLSRRQQFSPITLLLSGVMVGLFCSACQNILVLFNHQQLQNLFLWGSGNLTQNDWSVVHVLWPVLLLTITLTIIMVRPLNLLRLSDQMIDNMGASSQRIRLMGLLLVAILTAWLVSAVGLIGFIGLFAPQISRLLPHVRFVPHLFLVMFTGAVLLLLCDQLALLGEHFSYQATAGNITAIAGIPFMLFIIAKARFITPPILSKKQKPLPVIPVWRITIILILLILLALLCFSLTRNVNGWLITWQDPQGWRWPRVVVAAVAGGLLAIAGVILQRLTGNPLASPEVLGVNSGAACGVVLLLMFTNVEIGIGLFPSALLGATLSLLLLMLFIIRSRSQTARILLIGTALSAMSSAVITLLLTSGDPRAMQIINWLSGSTWRATASSALIGVSAIIICLPIAFLFCRWLTILPLGSGISTAVGIPLRNVQLVLLLYCALLSAIATLLIGPMSFVGLLAPQLIRRWGIYRPALTLIGAVIIGAVIMLIADWLGRLLIWPFQIPAGLLATMIGAPIFVIILNRR